MLLALIALGVFLQQHESPRFLRADPQISSRCLPRRPTPDSMQTDASSTIARIAAATHAADVAPRVPTQDRSLAVCRGAWPHACACARASRGAGPHRQVEDDIRPYVRAAKHHFLRLRPYEIEPQLDPCIADVRGDLSYPSGHATYAYVIAYLLADMVPERRTQLLERAREFARQRAVCGVHFPSDIDAGRLGAEWLARRFLQQPEYRTAAIRPRVSCGRDGSRAAHGWAFAELRLPAR
jgi:acid phosphatase (class A)